jgi:DNA invertase Pin-like site-specific DNA recombinase
MIRAALLARVSSSSQSADLQLDELRAVAKQRGWKVVVEATDVGSGARADLPERARVLDEARRGKVDLIAVWRLDRLGRSLRDLIEISSTLRRCKVELFSLRDAVDTGTPAGQLLFSVLGAIAQFERELIGERVRAGLTAARARGVVFGRPRRAVDVGAARRLLDDGHSIRFAARKIGVSARTLDRALVRHKPVARHPSKRPRKPLARARAAGRGRK